MNAEALGLMAIVVQTGALFFWGGRVHQLLKEHQDRLNNQRERIERLERHIPRSGHDRRAEAEA